MNHYEFWNIFAPGAALGLFVAWVVLGLLFAFAGDRRERRARERREQRDLDTRIANLRVEAEQLDADQLRMQVVGTAVGIIVGLSAFIRWARRR